MQVVHIIHDLITQSVLQLGCAVLCTEQLVAAVPPLPHYCCITGLQMCQNAAACSSVQAYALLVVPYVAVYQICDA